MENIVADDDHVRIEHHPMMSVVASFAVQARKNKSVKIRTAQPGNSIEITPEVWAEKHSNNDWKQIMVYDYNPDLKGRSYSGGNLTIV